MFVFQYDASTRKCHKLLKEAGLMYFDVFFYVYPHWSVQNDWDIFFYFHDTMANLNPSQTFWILLSNTFHSKYLSPFGTRLRVILAQLIYCFQLRWSRSIGYKMTFGVSAHVTPVAIAGTNIRVPTHLIKSLCLIWRRDIHRFHLRWFQLTWR